MTFIVSPANSFGLINGGIDFAISKNLGWHIEKRLQKVIKEKHFGELLVGQAEIIPTDHTDFPYLISAPTTIHRSPNVYLSMKAILTLLNYRKFETGEPIKDKIKTVALSGLGTGVGQVAPLLCARSMRIAWEKIMNEKFKTKKGWEELQSNYAYFFTHHDRDITYPIP